MLNRRHLRVRVLQTVYAYQVSDEKEVSKYEKHLLKSIDEVYQLYIWTLNLIEEVTAQAIRDADERANKFLPTAEDLNVDTKLESNTFVLALQQNPAYISAMKKYKVSWSFDPEIARDLFHQLKATTEYTAYLQQTDRSIAAEKDIIRFLFRKLILNSPLVDQAFETRFINWTIDKDVLQAMISKTLKNFSSEIPAQNQLASLTHNWEEDKEFALDLLRHVIRFESDYYQMINEKTKNWETERIAMMDVLLMRMAICELLNFPSIPVKVTMNEYIDMAKGFSTMKSSTFINGILDKILHDLQNGNRIHKNQRGLKD